MQLFALIHTSSSYKDLIPDLSQMAHLNFRMCPMREDMKMVNEKTAVIRDLNDRFRMGDKSVPGRVLVTSGVNSLLEENNIGQNKLMTTVREFDDFTPDNDPHLEHDFAAFKFLKNAMFWKFDYYAPDMEHGSNDPADIHKTVRVLTIMLAEEY